MKVFVAVLVCYVAYTSARTIQVGEGEKISRPCRSENIGARYPHEWNPQRYYECTKKGLVVEKCRVWEKYNNKCKACVNIFDHRPLPCETQESSEEVVPDPEPIDSSSSEEVIPDPEPIESSEEVIPDPDPVESSEEVIPDPEPVESSEEVIPDPEPVESSEEVIPDPEPVESSEEVIPDPEPVESSEEVVPTDAPVESSEEVIPDPEPVESSEVVAPTDAPVESSEEVAPTDAPVESSEEVAPTDAPVESSEEVVPTDAPVESSEEIIPTDAPVESESSEEAPGDDCKVECAYHGEYLANPESCHSFYQCSWGTPYLHQCADADAAGNKLVFDPSRNVCVWPREYACSGKPGCSAPPPPPDCPTVQCEYHGQYLQNPADCHSFYQCSWGTPYLHHCAMETASTRLVFNPTLNVCDWSANYPCNEC